MKPLNSRTVGMNRNADGKRMPGASAGPRKSRGEREMAGQKAHAEAKEPEPQRFFMNYRHPSRFWYNKCRKPRNTAERSYQGLLLKDRRRGRWMDVRTKAVAGFSKGPMMDGLMKELPSVPPIKALMPRPSTMLRAKEDEGRVSSRIDAPGGQGETQSIIAPRASERMVRAVGAAHSLLEPLRAASRATQSWITALISKERIIRSHPSIVEPEPQRMRACEDKPGIQGQRTMPLLIREGALASGMARADAIAPSKGPPGPEPDVQRPIGGRIPKGSAYPANPYGKSVSSKPVKSIAPGRSRRASGYEIDGYHGRAGGQRKTQAHNPSSGTSEFVHMPRELRRKERPSSGKEMSPQSIVGRDRDAIWRLIASDQRRGKARQLKQALDMPSLPE